MIRKFLRQTLSPGRPVDYVNIAEATVMNERLKNARGSSQGVDRIWQMWLDEIEAG